MAVSDLFGCGRRPRQVYSPGWAVKTLWVSRAISSSSSVGITRTLTGESTYSFTFTVSEDEGDPVTENESGTYTLDDSNVIQFTPGPESEDEEPSEGTWDGDEITVLVESNITIVFRR